MKKRLAIDYFALGISFILSPYLVALIFIVTISYVFSENLAQFLPWAMILVFFSLLVPVAYILYLVEAKKVSNWHLSRHAERRLPFMVGTISALIGTLALFVLHAAKPLMVFGLTFSFNALLITIITFFWKISLHTALFSSLVTISAILFGWHFLFLLFLLIPLGWSRYHRQRHTIAQVIAGAVVSFGATLLIFYLFGYHF
jgi:cytochrome c biogenesis protein CcdA